MNFKFKIRCKVNYLGSRLEIIPELNGLQKITLDKKQFNLIDDNCDLLIESNLKFVDGNLSKLSAHDIIDKKKMNRMLVTSIFSENFSTDISSYQLHLFPMNDKILNDDLLEFIREEATQKYISQTGRHNEDWTITEAELALVFYMTSINLSTADMKKDAVHYTNNVLVNRTADALLFKCAGFKRLQNGDDTGLGNLGKIFHEVWYNRINVIERFKK